MLTDKYSPYLLRFAIEIELKKMDPPDPVKASMIAVAKLENNENYYTENHGYTEPMSKAGGTHKYIKKIERPGKPALYFYTMQQIKDYKEKGILPGEKKGLFQSIMSFFGAKNKEQAKEKAKQEYKENEIKEKFGVTFDSWINHLSEYFRNKEKWDSLFLKKLESQREVKASSDSDKAKAMSRDVSEGKKIQEAIKKVGLNLKIMYFIFNKYNKIQPKEGAQKNGKSKIAASTKTGTDFQGGRVPSDMPEVHSGRTQGTSLQNVPERKSTGDRANNVLSSGLPGERSGRNVRITKSQIKATREQILNLLNSKTDEEMTEEDKELLRQYEGAGGIKEDDKTIHGTLYEYYTPQKVVDKVWEIVNKYIGKGRNKVLEPSAGIGRFAEKQDHDFTMFELDKTSSRINKILYPEADVQNKAFQELFMKGGQVKPEYKGQKFNVVIGNPPYGEYAGFHKGLGEGKQHKRYEEYFIDRGLDTLEPGGILAYVVPSGFLRGNQYSDVKSAIAKKGRLLEAYRLPNGTFSTTGVGTDVIIIRKEPGSIDDFLDDKYFKKNPEKILGVEATRNGRFGAEQYVSLKPGETFDAAIDGIDANAEKPVPVGVLTEKQQIAEKIKNNIIRKEKKKVAENNFETMPEYTGTKQVETAESFNKKYNKKFNPEDLNLWKNTDYTGRIDIEKLSEKEKNNIKSNKNICIQEGNYYHITNYASGNISDKLNILENEKEKLSAEQYNRQKKILEDAMPQHKTVYNFSISPISDFAKNFEFKQEEGESVPFIKRFYEWATGSTYSNDRMNWSGGVTKHDIPAGMDWSDVREYIQQKSVRADTRGDKETNKAQAEKRKELRRDVTEKLFKRFIENGLNPDEQSQLENEYNYRFNSYAAPDYSAIPISVDGISSTFKGKDLIIKDKQLQGSSFLCNKGNGLLAYDVGLGKTLAGILATINQLQTGRAKRPVLCVPKAVYNNWIKEIRDLFPNVKINELGNLGSEYVSEKLEIEDGTLSIITYEALQKISFKTETIDSDLILDMVDSQHFEKEKMTDRDRAAQEQKIYERLGIAAKTKTEISEDGESINEDGEEIVSGASHYFENLGFDHITMDEAHNFKNVFGAAKPKQESGKQVANEFKGLVGGKSNRALKMFAVTQLIQKKNNDRNVFALSATPFTNSPLEIYNILSLVARKRLKELGIYNLHEFMTQFASLKSEWAVKPNGAVERKSVMKEFKNLTALQSLIREYIDKVDGEEAGIVRPVKNTHFAEVNMTPLQKAIAKIEMTRFDQKLPNGKPVPGATLKAINNLRMSSLSPSLMNFDDLYKDTDIPEMVAAENLVEDSPKLKFTFDSVSKFYSQRKDLGQVIYMPRGVERFKECVQHLIKNGIPKDAIAIISSKTSEKKKDQIMSDFNNPDGKIKVVIGSETIKEGVNLNGNTAVIYNTLLGWNPAETTQVEGRIWRQGNKQGNVHIVYPQLVDSVDAAMYQKHDEKSQRYGALWNYKGDNLNVEDVNAEELKFSLIKDPERRAKFTMDLKLEEFSNKKREIRIEIDTLTKFKTDYETNVRGIDREKKDLSDNEKYLSDNETELIEKQKELKEEKSKGKEKNDYSIRSIENSINSKENRIKSLKKDIRDNQKFITLTEKENEGIVNKLNLKGLNVSDIDKRIEEENKNIEDMVEEEHNIINNKSKYIAEAKAAIEANKKDIPPLSDVIKNHVNLLLGNLKPMDQVLTEMGKAGSMKFVKTYNEETNQTVYVRIQ